MFFCINLVFAGADARITKEEGKQDIVVSPAVNDYILTDAVIDPITKNNIDTYILKDNMKVSFSFSNHNLKSDAIVLSHYYLTTLKSKVLKIRCRDTAYVPGIELDVVPPIAYAVLKATGRIDDCIFVYNVTYTTENNGEKVEKTQNIYFKVVSEKEYNAYRSMKHLNEETVETKETGEIKRPKKQK